MSSHDPFLWSARTQIGLGLFAASLIYLVVAAPGQVAISFAVGAGACLALFGIAGSRFLLVLLTLLMLSVSACGLFAALVVGSFALLPAALAQIAAVALMESRDRSDWVSEAAQNLAPGNAPTRLLPGWARQRV